jgi:AraC family transcriptional regulator
MSRASCHQAAEQPSAFSHFLTTNSAREPDYVVCDPDGDVVAAKWHRPAARCTVEIALAQHTLMYHVGGSTSVAKFVDRRCVGTAARHGSVTFSPRDEHSEWVRGGVCEVMHVYIAPSLIERYADENLTCAAPPEIDPIFAIHDPWLESYFQLLQAEFGPFGKDSSRPEALLLTQSMELLLRHLVCWHSNVPKSVRQREASSSAIPLAPRHLARVLAYIDANAGRNITLDDLAQLVSISKYHFIRSFRAATQRTPYAFLVERRLAIAIDALRHSSLPIERIARAAGFQSAPGFSNVFKKHYGVSPGKFRAQSH